MNIANLHKDLKDIQVEGIITEVSPVKEFHRMNGSGKLAASLLKDESGEVQLTLWNEQVDLIKEGNKIRINSASIKEWNGMLQLSINNADFEILE